MGEGQTLVSSGLHFLIADPKMLTLRQLNGPISPRVSGISTKQHQTFKTNIAIIQQCFIIPILNCVYAYLSVCGYVDMWGVCEGIRFS